MDVSSVLAKAWEQVEKANLPPELQEVAFREAVRLLTVGNRDQPGEPQQKPSVAIRGNVSTRRAKTSKPSSSAPVDEASSRDTANQMTEDEFFAKISKETDVSVDDLELVFHLESGEPQLSVKTSQLGDSLKERMVNIARAICAVRAIAFSEDGTPVSVVRAECRRLRCLDEKNINRYLSNIDGIVYVGSTRSKRLKMRPAAEKEFPMLMAKLAGKGTSVNGQ